MSFIIKKAPEYNLKTLIALLLEQNKASIALLKKFSFNQWGLMPRAADFNGREDGHLYYGLRISDL
jgi:phosphinothricin acetyltransferase